MAAQTDDEESTLPMTAAVGCALLVLNISVFVAMLCQWRKLCRTRQKAAKLDRTVCMPTVNGGHAISSSGSGLRQHRKQEEEENPEPEDGSASCDDVCRSPRSPYGGFKELNTNRRVRHSPTAEQLVGVAVCSCESVTSYPLVPSALLRSSCVRHGISRRSDVVDYESLTQLCGADDNGSCNRQVTSSVV